MADKGVSFFNGTAAVGTTDAALISASPNARIRVHAVIFATPATPAATIQFNSKGSGAGTAISGALPRTATTASVLSGGEIGLFQTNRGEALTATTGAGTNAEGLTIVYSTVY